MNAIKFELADDGIALLTIDLPGKPINVLGPELQSTLADAIERVASTPEIRGAIITSGKASGFIAGADLKELVAAYDAGITLLEAMQVSRSLSTLFRRLETCGKPIVAAINGVALGGGLELCLACHYRILADDTRSQIGLPEVKVGLLPGAGGTQRLPRLIGIPAALPLLLEGRSLKPGEALKLGLVHELAPANELVAAARRWLLVAAPEAAIQPWDRKNFSVPGGVGPMATHAAQTFIAGNALAASQSAGNYPAPLAILSAVFEGTQVPIETALRIESKYFAKLLSSPVARNLIRTMFINKGAAEKLAARPQDIPRSKVSKVGVLGAGLMGAGISHVSAQAGIEVVLLDASFEQAARGKEAIAESLSRDLAKGRIPQARIDSILDLIKVTSDYADLAGCDLVVEAVFEQREVKAEVTKKAEAFIPENAIFGSNTSTLPITGLAQSSLRPSQYIGLHFFSPVEKCLWSKLFSEKRLRTKPWRKRSTMSAN